MDPQIWHTLKDVARMLWVFSKLHIPICITRQIIDPASSVHLGTVRLASVQSLVVWEMAEDSLRTGLEAHFHSS